MSFRLIMDYPFSSFNQHLLMEFWSNFLTKSWNDGQPKEEDDDDSKFINL